jgi:hypothetical protein
MGYKQRGLGMTNQVGAKDTDSGGIGECERWTEKLIKKNTRIGFLMNIRWVV